MHSDGDSSMLMMKNIRVLERGIRGNRILFVLELSVFGRNCVALAWRTKG